MKRNECGISYSEASGSIPDCPILQTSSENILLLQPGFLTHHDPPTVGFHDPLYQISFNRHATCLTMLVQIPDLGIVVAACQRGRAGIFTVTELDGSVDIDAEPSTAAASSGITERRPTRVNVRRSPNSKKKPSTHRRGEDATQARIASTSCAFRLDHILPTLDQEIARKRPGNKGLIGIATAPIQGVRSSAGHRNRWRLILTYSNCTLLSYELSRSIEGEVEALIL